MIPDDPRHATSAGYVAGCREQCCRDAIADWTRHRRTRRYLLGDLRVSNVGTHRRIRALMALGWSTTLLDARIGRARTFTAAILCRPDSPVHRSTAKMYAELYERLSMTEPPGETRYEKQRRSRVRNYAAKMGWPPPLAWDDIDNPDEEPAGAYRAPGVQRDATGGFLWPDEPVDEVAVQRVLSGDWRLACTKADKFAVVARWPGSLKELGRLTGWKVERYMEKESA